MFDPIVKIAGIIVSTLPKLDLPEKRRRKYAHSLLELYGLLKKLVGTGNELLDILALGHSRDPKILISLLSAQNRRIRNIKKFFKNNRFESILSIKFPEIDDLQILLHRKKEYIVIAMNNSNAWQEKEKDPNLVNVLPRDFAGSIRGFSDNLYFASGFSLKKCRDELTEILKLTEKLRCYIDETFTESDLM